jgi:hypothetical protein
LFEAHVLAQRHLSEQKGKSVKSAIRGHPFALLSQCSPVFSFHSGFHIVSCMSQFFMGYSTLWQSLFFDMKI